MLLASSGQRSGMRLNIRRCTGQPHNTDLASPPCQQCQAEEPCLRVREGFAPMGTDLSSRLGPDKEAGPALTEGLSVTADTGQGGCWQGLF